MAELFRAFGCPIGPSRGGVSLLAGIDGTVALVIDDELYEKPAPPPSDSTDLEIRRRGKLQLQQERRRRLR